jgi:hypothetical protein
MTPEEIAEDRKAKQDRIDARIAELKLCEGKIYIQNDGQGPLKTIKRYAGIFPKDGALIYTFEVEVNGHANWNAPATEFLDSHHVVEVKPVTETSNEPI